MNPSAAGRHDVGLPAALRHERKRVVHASGKGDADAAMIRA